MLRTAMTAIAGLAMIGAVQTAEAETWDLPMAYSATNFHSVTGAEFAKCVTTGTGGELELVTHPSGSLYKGAEIKRAVQTGQVNIGERLLSGHQNENAIFGIDSVPFLATSFDDSDKLYAAAKPTLEKILADQGLTLLYAVPWPPQGIYANKEVNSVADLEGVKFRAYNIATGRFAELAKMIPVQIEAAELSQALATGVAEAFISSGATGYDRKVWEHLSHFYEVDAWMPRNYMLVNTAAYEGLDEATQNVLHGCAQIAEYAGTWRAKEYTGFTLAGLREGGMTVGRAGEQLDADFKAIGETMANEWLDSAGEEGKAIIDAFRAE